MGITINIRAMLQHLLDEYRAKTISENPHITEAQLDAITHKIQERVDNEPPPKIAFIGETGVGKSSTLNALFNAGLDVSHTEACTQDEQAIEIKTGSLDGNNGVLVFYDMPGLGESKSTRQRHLEVYARILKQVDVALWVLDAQHRAIEFVQEQLSKEIRDIQSDLADRMVFALNKVDLVQPGEKAWHPLANLPSSEQEANINSRIKDVERKVKEALPTWRGTVVGYSAHKRYKLPQLFSTMLDAVPQKRQWVVASRKALADFFELVDPKLLSSVGDQPGVPKRPTVVKETREERVSRIVTEMTPEEFSKVSANKEAFEQWLRNHFK